MDSNNLENLEKYLLLDQAGMKSFAKEIMRSVESKIDYRIVNEVGEASSDKQIPSAAALYNIVTEINESLSNCWTKDGEATTVLKEQLGLADVDDRFAAVEVDLSKKLDIAAVDVISMEELQSIIQAAIDATDPFPDDGDVIDPSLVDG